MVNFTRKDKFPRKLWWPSWLSPSQTDLNPDEWKEQHEETSKTIRRLIMVSIGYCFFCFLTLAAPDNKLFEVNALVKVPFANVQVPYVFFLILGPLVLIGITIYTQIFIEHWHILNEQIKFLDEFREKTLPFLFNMGRYTPDLISNFLFYWLTPLALFIFVWKSSAILIYIIAVLVTVILLLLKIRRFPIGNRRSFHYTFYWLILIFFIISCIPVILNPSIIHRGLNLPGVNLSKGNLRGVNFDKANLKNANFKSADLSNASLKGANLRGAQLETASLERANLLRANLTYANLQKTLLREANFQETLLVEADLQDSVLVAADFENAHLWSANLQNAELGYAVLKNADLREANLQNAELGYAVLKNADLRGANLQKANLMAAELQKANLRSAELQKANLRSAVLLGANLSGANLTGCYRLTQEQLDLACGNEETKLPSGLTIKKCPEKKE
jgi:uncharacterized protein YjbI with pentapeptide repeats